MKNPDVTLTDIYDVIRVTFNTNVAIEAANNEPEIVSFLTRKDGMLFLDIEKSPTNKLNVMVFCKTNQLIVINE